MKIRGLVSIVAFLALLGSPVVRAAEEKPAAKTPAKAARKPAPSPAPPPTLSGLNPQTMALAGTPDNTTPAGFVALFSGKDLKGWKGLLARPNDNPYTREKLSSDELAKAEAEANDNMQQHWKVEEGAIAYDGKGRSLCTTKDYGDFELWCDWKIEPKGDSGLYIRSSPQVQIWDPADDHNDRAKLGSGALFNNQKHPADPLVKADKPIGEWNTFFIRMVGDQVTVYLNGKLVVDNVTMENYWAKQSKMPETPIFAKGDIQLQQHNSKLWFKNLYLKELPASGK